MHRLESEGTAPQVSGTLIYCTERRQVDQRHLPHAFLSGDFEVTARLSMFSATSGYSWLNSTTQGLF